MAPRPVLKSSGAPRRGARWCVHERGEQDTFSRHAVSGRRLDDLVQWLTFHRREDAGIAPPIVGKTEQMLGRVSCRCCGGAPLPRNCPQQTISKTQIALRRMFI
jgi:hypothetical protein